MGETEYAPRTAALAVVKSWPDAVGVTEPNVELALRIVDGNKDSYQRDEAAKAVSALISTGVPGEP
jgi:hypothetical protein